MDSLGEHGQLLEGWKLYFWECVIVSGRFFKVDAWTISVMYYGRFARFTCIGFWVGSREWFKNESV